jgi:hypothetical protein
VRDVLGFGVVSFLRVGFTNVRTQIFKNFHGI